MKNFKILAIIAFITISCGMNAQKKIEVRGNSSSVTSQQGKDVNITGSDIKKTITMNGGNLNISGSDCTITVNGSVNTISVTGSDVTINADRVNSVKIVGSDTHVFYKTSGNRKGRPSVSITGSDSGVTKR